MVLGPRLIDAEDESLIPKEDVVAARSCADFAGDYVCGTQAIKMTQSEQGQPLWSSDHGVIDADDESSIPKEDVVAARSRADLAGDCVCGTQAIKITQSEQGQPRWSSDHD